jgi:hypothetical protein
MQRTGCKALLPTGQGFVPGSFERGETGGLHLTQPAPSQAPVVRPRYVAEYEEEEEGEAVPVRYLPHGYAVVERPPPRLAYVRENARPPAGRGWSAPPRQDTRAREPEPPPPRWAAAAYEDDRPSKRPRDDAFRGEDRNLKQYHHKTFINLRASMVGIYDKLTGAKVRAASLALCAHLLPLNPTPLYALGVIDGTLSRGVLGGGTPPRWRTQRMSW